jgi:ribose/xylose/arabinose/galactoside ABC-type transport system permease subunit
MKRIIGLVSANVFLIVLLAITTPYFFSINNLVVLVDNIALEAIALSGYTLLLIGGYFDLSIDGIVSLTGVVAGLLMVTEVNWIVAVSVALVLSGLIGFINGFIVVKLGINGLIATLTTWWITIGLSLGMTKALSPYGFPDAFQLIGQTRLFGFRSAVPCAIFVVIILSILLHWHRIGAHIYAIGDNKQSSMMMGINVNKLGIGLYILVGLLSGFIGLMIASRLNAASPIAVDGMALRVIAAVVIGGGSLSGGKGSIVAGLLGLCMMHILGNAIIQLGISPYYQKAVLGIILLAAVLLETQNIKLRRKQNVQ